MSLTVSTSWPGSRLTVSGARRCAESATATARWRISSASLSGSVAAASGWCGATAKTKGSVPSSLHRTPARQLAADADADREVGLAGDERLPGAGHHLGAQAQARRRRRGAPAAGRRGVDASRASRAVRRERVERLAQLEHRRARDHAVDGDRELRLPAGGDALDAVGDRVHLLEQAAAFVEQLAGRPR